MNTTTTAHRVDDATHHVEATTMSSPPPTRDQPTAQLLEIRPTASPPHWRLRDGCACYYLSEPYKGTDFLVVGFVESRDGDPHMALRAWTAAPNGEIDQLIHLWPYNAAGTTHDEGLSELGYTLRR